MSRIRQLIYKDIKKLSRKDVYKYFDNLNSSVKTDPIISIKTTSKNIILNLNIKDINDEIKSLVDYEMKLFEDKIKNLLSKG